DQQEREDKTADRADNMCDRWNRLEKDESPNPKQHHAEQPIAALSRIARWWRVCATDVVDWNLSLWLKRLATHRVVAGAASSATLSDKHFAGRLAELLRLLAHLIHRLAWA